MFRAEKTMFRLQATSARLLGFLGKIMYVNLHFVVVFFINPKLCAIAIPPTPTISELNELYYFFI